MDMHSTAMSKVFLKSTRLLRNYHSSSALYQGGRKLDGRIAVALGCTDGLGFSMAKRLAEEGAHVILSSRRQEQVDVAVDKLQAQGLSASGLVCHAGRAEDRSNLLDHTRKIHGGFDILINNAGVNPHSGPLLDTPDSALDKVFDVNVKANFSLVRDAVPFMEGRKHTGSILLTSSVSGYQSHVYPGAYAISKSTIFSLVGAFVPELIQRNIRINCVALGLFNTRFADVISKNEEAKERVFQHVPMKRIGEPEEAAGVASFLCSDDSSYITGETFCIAGGFFSRL